MKLLIFTYAPAGLGHLRVTDALFDKKPDGYKYVLIGSGDKLISRVHRFFSANIFARLLFTISQYGLLEYVFTHLYRGILYLTAGRIKREFADIILREKEVSEVLIVSTHFGLAHQIGRVKASLSKELGVDIRLAVQVTDDTTQRIWYVRQADLIVVPSKKTKKVFESSLSRFGVRVMCAPYPIGESLIGEVSHENKIEALKGGRVNVCIPISGAMVGLSYLTSLIEAIRVLSTNFHFYVVIKQSVFSDMYIKRLQKIDQVDLITGTNDFEMIEKYEKLYEENIVHIEITKPSEQAFKAILPTNTRGGVLMLFTHPVGRQEFENLAFLKRKRMLRKNESDKSFRAIKLSERVSEDSKMIADLYYDGWLLKALVGSGVNKRIARDGELGPNGSHVFWEEVAKINPA